MSRRLPSHAFPPENGIEERQGSLVEQEDGEGEGEEEEVLSDSECVESDLEEAEDEEAEGEAEGEDEEAEDQVSMLTSMRRPLVMGWETSYHTGSASYHKGSAVWTGSRLALHAFLKPFRWLAWLQLPDTNARIAELEAPDNINSPFPMPCCAGGGRCRAAAATLAAAPARRARTSARSQPG